MFYSLHVLQSFHHLTNFDLSFTELSLSIIVCKCSSDGYVIAPSQKYSVACYLNATIHTLFLYSCQGRSWQLCVWQCGVS